MIDNKDIAMKTKSMKRREVPFVSFFRVKPECMHLFNKEHKVTEMSPELYAEVFKM